MSEAGSELDKFGNVAGGIGTAVGSLGGAHAHDAASGLPEWMLIGVTDSTVYGFAGRVLARSFELGLRLRLRLRVRCGGCP